MSADWFDILFDASSLLTEGSRLSSPKQTVSDQFPEIIAKICRL
jgi:hypothetical protein